MDGWSNRKAAFKPKPDDLQSCMDAVLKECPTYMKTVPFSLTIADPLQSGCPLIGCSSAFLTLSGYSEKEIIGKNCRFLIDPVPDDLVNKDMRSLVRSYIETVRHGKQFSLPENMKQIWMPTSLGLIRRVGSFWSGVDLKLDDGGLFCFQTNARKQGSLFRNMFFLHSLELFGAPYIIGMQAHIPDPKVAENLWGLLPGNARLYRTYSEVATQDMQVLREACQSLLRNLAYLEGALLQMVPLAVKSLLPSDSWWKAGDVCKPAPFCCRMTSPGPISTTTSIPVLKSPGKLPVPESIMEAESLAILRFEQISQHSASAGLPCTALRACLEDVRTDWDAVHAILQNILKPEYTVEAYTKHLLQAFPELVVQLFEWRLFNVRQISSHGSTSGRSGEDEYQRTMATFFAIFWIVRSDVDGKDGFCFGVDAHGKARTFEEAGAAKLSAMDKRVAFRDKMQWSFMQLLFGDAGVLHLKGGRVEVDTPRLAALLCFTAFHDLMKVEHFLPQVAKGEYHGFKEGEKIQDHDVALAYIMDNYPELLPSFRSLSPEQRASIQFMQCKIAFNHGWFVQGEAPPGAVFSTFRNVLCDAQRSGKQVNTQEIALYFVHWLTDLAGAEGTPNLGCEKFVIKFPMPVLMSFLRSFEFVEKLAAQSETDVMETYLRFRWSEQKPPRGPAPQGPSAVALMRLFCMAQGNAGAILDAFEQLGCADRELLSTEMSRTGCRGQTYTSTGANTDRKKAAGGPAILVYYGPALLQDLRGDVPVSRLALLAEVYRCARALWPLREDQVAKNVTVRIDAIKAISLTEIKATAEPYSMWLVVRENDNEATVQMALRSAELKSAERMRLPH
mmetsp:Transcript_48883/g.114410  ORF Transcript_48883/g.114410 Transcript_48883/m.114410 type:complete len:844 (+) Transcript_48883:79-2610(+)